MHKTLQTISRGQLPLPAGGHVCVLTVLIFMPPLSMSLIRVCRLYVRHISSAKAVTRSRITIAKSAYCFSGYCAESFAVGFTCMWLKLLMESVNRMDSFLKRCHHYGFTSKLIQPLIDPLMKQLYDRMQSPLHTQTGT